MKPRKIYQGLGNRTDPKKLEFIEEHAGKLTVPEMADLTGCSTCFIYDYLNAKNIKYKKADKGQPYIRNIREQSFREPEYYRPEPTRRPATQYTNLTREQLIDQLLNG